MGHSRKVEGDASVLIEMAEAKSTEKVCVELLADALRNPVTSARQSYYILERLALCFVSVARDVKNLTVEVYGNGTPGGIKEEIRSLNRDIAFIKDAIERLSKDSKPDEKKEDSDWFRSTIRWFIDKVLPYFVTSLLTLILSALFWYMQNMGTLNP